jgi:hypothetical protein
MMELLIRGNIANFGVHAPSVQKMQPRQLPIAQLVAWALDFD